MRYTYIKGPQGQPIRYDFDDTPKTSQVFNGTDFVLETQQPEDLSWLYSRDIPTLTEDQRRSGHFLLPYFSDVDKAVEGGIGSVGEAYTPTNQRSLNYYDIVPPNPTPSSQWRWNTFEKKWDDPTKEAGWKEELNKTMGIVIPAILSYATGGITGAAVGSTAAGGAAAGSLSNTISGGTPEEGLGSMFTGAFGSELNASDPYGYGNTNLGQAGTAATTSGLVSAAQGADEEQIARNAAISGLSSYAGSTARDYYTDSTGGGPVEPSRYNTANKLGGLTSSATNFGLRSLWKDPSAASSSDDYQDIINTLAGFRNQLNNRNTGNLNLEDLQGIENTPEGQQLLSLFSEQDQPASSRSSKAGGTGQYGMGSDQVEQDALREDGYLV